MTVHFINLVSWRHFLEHKGHSIKHLDSISIVILAYLFGFRFPRSSGVEFYSENLDTLSNSLFLTARECSSLSHYYVLPYWNDLDQISLPADLRNMLKGYDKCVLGISSPKQDILARIIEKQFPNISIYCLGAAIYPQRDKSFVLKNGHFLWLYFLIVDPKRTWPKLRITFMEIWRIIFSKRDRKLFRRFLHNL